MKRLVLLLLVLLWLAPSSVACPPPQPTVVDHIAFDRLPSGLGTTSDFAYHFQRVDFVARVWESQIPEGWRVDLDLVVMRGARLTDAQTFHDWFIRYEERDPTPVYRPVRIHGHRGWLTDDQVFWLIRPRLAVSATLDGTRWTRQDVRRIALGAHVVGHR